MCGIVGGFGPNVGKGVEASRHRGPDGSGLVNLGNLSLGHTRLAILDPEPRSAQPFHYGKTWLTYNGELWNYRALRTELQTLGRTFTTTGDTEVVAAALDTWGTDALPKLDGMFAMGWSADGDTLYLARDRFGEVPLHYVSDTPFYFASEVKALLAMDCAKGRVRAVGPGQVLRVQPGKGETWHYYYAPIQPLRLNAEDAALALERALEAETVARTISDVPVCTQLSGGLDSSIITCLLAKALPGLVAYTAVYDEHGPDRKFAHMVADHAGVELREVRVPLPTPSDMADVVKHIEMSSKVQVEIGWLSLKLAEAMQADGFKVTFSGEGSDELFADYGFCYHGLQKQDWHSYRRDLFLKLGRTNFVRANKIFMAHGVECRLPFAGKQVVELCLGLTQKAVRGGDGKKVCKAVLADAFRGLVPDPVLKRVKVAFQDGCGMKDAIAGAMHNTGSYYEAVNARLYGG